MPCSSPDRLERISLAIPEKLLKKSVVGKGRRVELSFRPSRSTLAIRFIFARPGGSWIRAPVRRRSTAARSILCRAKPRPDLRGFVGQAAAQIREAVGNAQRTPGLRRSGLPGRSYRMFQSTMTGPYNPEEFGLSWANRLITRVLRSITTRARIDLRRLPADCRRHFRRLFRQVRDPEMRTYETTNPCGGSRLAGIRLPSAGRAFRRPRLVGVAADARLAGWPHHAAG